MYFQDILMTIKTDWHKIVVVTLVLAHVWKFFYEYVKPVVKPTDKEHIQIKLPKNGRIVVSVAKVPVPVSRKRKRS
jgi:hypothetical protein